MITTAGDSKVLNLNEPFEPAVAYGKTKLREKADHLQ